MAEAVVRAEASVVRAEASVVRPAGQAAVELARVCAREARGFEKGRI